MSELINIQGNGATIRWKLLIGVSSLALTAYVSSTGVAGAEDMDHPPLWIELGGQLERLNNSQEALSPPFFSQVSPAVLAPMVDAERLSAYSIGENGKITFESQDSKWLFSASIRYGRSGTSKHKHYQSAHTTTQTLFGRPATENGRPIERFGDGQAVSKESHFLLDFQAGKDVGLGLFGARGTSVVSAGVRFAQFSSNSDITLRARPLYHSGPFVTKYVPGHPLSGYRLHAASFQNNTAVIQSRRSARAIGPSLSWDASAQVFGNNSTMAVTFDWGVNGAVLFGRQRARVHHQTTGAHLYDYPGGYYPSKQSGYANHPADQNRVRTVTIPNIGGFAGISLKFPNAKVALGYRADFFFGAMDSGIDTARKTDIGFYGPFATISVGIGG